MQLATRFTESIPSDSEISCRYRSRTHFSRNMAHLPQHGANREMPNNRLEVAISLAHSPAHRRFIEQPFCHNSRETPDDAYVGLVEAAHASQAIGWRSAMAGSSAIRSMRRPPGISRHAIRSMPTGRCRRRGLQRLVAAPSCSAGDFRYEKQQAVITKKKYRLCRR